MGKARSREISYGKAVRESQREGLRTKTTYSGKDYATTKQIQSKDVLWDV